MQRPWIGWVFLILGLGTSGFGVIMLAIRLVALRRWTRVEGEVIESAVLGPDGEKEYSANVTVRWRANGSEYSKKFDNWGSGRKRDTFEQIAAHYPKASSTPILCNPSNPSKAFLDAGYTLSFFLGPAILIVCGLVIAMIGFSVKAR
jgi:hypothetical protein